MINCFLDEQYFCAECWKEFHEQMHLQQYEKVQLVGKSLPSDNSVLTIKDMLLMQSLWEQKYDTYSSKDKLLSLKGSEHFSVLIL